MSRKQFIESLGATCTNWNWSWSFINRSKKEIIFGVWDDRAIGANWLVFTYDWERNENGQKNKGFQQSRDHIAHIENEGYKLYVFRMFAVDGSDPIKIRDFERKLLPKKLLRKGNDWYATEAEESILPEEIQDAENEYIEGTKSIVTVNSYERNPEAREKCIEHFGCFCSVCGFDFEKHYGLLGANYIHVHHLIPLNEIKKEYSVNPTTDLIPVCANCHAMLHRGRKTISIESLKEHIHNADKTHNKAH
jgi:5-methylcytosine-specific restriction protein A